MKQFAMALLLLGAVLTGSAQDGTVILDEQAVRSAQQWARENLDEDALRVLGEADETKVRKYLADVQREFQGDHVIDLAQLKEAATTILPLLEAYEETVPYAVWLKARLDYLDVAEQFRLVIPPPKIQPGVKPPPAPNPAPKMEREAWNKAMERRPWPKAAQPYVAQLKPIFAAERVPAELVWVAEVESSFDPRARSPAGAAGLFQLMPDTAKRYGLRLWPFDQRLQADAGGRAAAQYLRYLHGRFKDWRLALAAYNSGEGTVARLLSASRAKDFDAIATRLPAETQMFVPKVEATLHRREGLKLVELRAPAKIENPR